MTAKERRESARQAGLASAAARAKRLSEGERSEFARQAVAARWGKRKKQSKAPD
jgi:hypothetical protein